jgi:hypothetical protein
MRRNLVLGYNQLDQTTQLAWSVKSQTIKREAVDICTFQETPASFQPKPNPGFPQFLMGRLLSIGSQEATE